MPITILLPAVLRDHVDGRAELEADAADVAGALAALTRDHPVLGRHLFGEAGELRTFVNVYVNQDEVRDLPEGLGTRLSPGDVLLILPSIAGG